MRRTETLSRDERGLVGKIIVLWLVLGLLLALAAVDTVQILVARFKVADAAQGASFEAARTLKTSGGDRRAAFEAAKDAVAETDADAKMKDFVVNPASAEVTVTVTKRVSTILVGRFGLFDGFTRATATETAPLPP